MEELKRKVVESAGITDAQATIATETVIRYLKDRVPPILHSQLDKIFAGSSLEDSIRSQVGGLGSDVKERTEGLARDLKQAFEEAFRSKKSGEKE
ncbi:MAG: hypothetical protein M3Q95_08855 [Bacteroidota bacterium]|nr:hypothetical protein [Bacteroidota bacterium]